MTQFVRRIIPILFCFITVVVNANEEWNPLAQEEAVVTSGNARFTILTPRLIRIQYSSTGKFEDRATFAVVNRRLPVPAYTLSLIHI